MHIPIQTKLPRLDLLTVEWHGRHFSLPYFYRDGTGGPAILFVHGLGGAKENFYAAFQSPALADCTLATFDEPGTGLAAFDPMPDSTSAPWQTWRRVLRISCYLALTFWPGPAWAD
jgi:pimeloyl-ACP methyl ester carboxylesterase